MKRQDKKLNERAEHVLREINERPVSISRAVGQLAQELFLSERTVWYDFQKALNSRAASGSKY
jgi:hypothetical protein